MPSDDPLHRPLDSWSPNDLASLLGRTESDRLETKGSGLLITASTGRQKVAEAIAGFTSASGGYVIVGSQEGGDSIERLPGLEVTADEVENLRRSILDLVRPSGLFAGPRTFPGQDEDRSVIVFQVFTHPAGLPASVLGTFWLRVGSDTRRMDWDEVRRRFTAARDLTDSAVETAKRVLNELTEPHTSYWERALTQRGHPGHVFRPFAVACVPLGGPRDLGYSGGDLLSALRRAANDERAAVDTHMPGGAIDLIDNARITGDGLAGVTAGDSGFRLTHDGVMGAALCGVLDPFSTGAVSDTRAVEVWAARYLVLAARFVAELVGSVPVYVKLDSGSLQGLPVQGGTPRFDSVAHEFTMPARGTEAAQAILTGARLLATRMANAVGHGDTARHEQRLEEYLLAAVR